MSAVAAIVLADAQATPVNHTFTPSGPDQNGVWWFEDQSQSTPAGFWRISLQLVRVPPLANGQSSTSNRVNRVKINLHMPTLEVLSAGASGIQPAPTVSYIDRGGVEFVLPDRDSLQNRKDQRKMLKNLFDNTMVIDMVENLTNVY